MGDCFSKTEDLIVIITDIIQSTILFSMQNNYLHCEIKFLNWIRARGLNAFIDGMFI